jgi:hypothetical protein
VLFVALNQMHHLHPFAAPGQKNKLVEISQNYLVIFTENREHPTSNAYNFRKTYFDACLTTHFVAFYQTRHLRLFSGSIRKNSRFYSSKSEKCSVLEV